MLAEFRANPLVAEWLNTLTSQSAKELHPQFLYTHFSRSIQVRGYTLKAWVEEVGNQQRSPNGKERRAWAIELTNFLNTYVSPITGKPWQCKSGDQE